MTKSQMAGSMCSRLSAIGIPTRTKVQLVDEITKWVNCNGYEWTVARLKALATDLVRSWANLPPSNSDVASIAYRNGVPKGPFGYLWSMRSQRGRIKALSCAMVYSSFRSPVVTQKQFDKFVKSVLVLIPDEVRARREVSWKGLDPTIRRVESRSSREYVLNVQGLFDRYPWSSEIRMPTLRGRTHPEIMEGRSPLDHIFELTYYSQIFQELLLKHKVLQQAIPEELRESMVTLASYITEGRKKTGRLAVPRSWNLRDNVGKISYIQESGYKLRAVANPLRIYQVALEPFKKDLDTILKGQPWSSVHDQDVGVQAVQNALRQGKAVHTIDLADATNHFPLGFQANALLPLTVGPFAEASKDLFLEVSRQPWLLPTLDGRLVPVIWNEGQPLGLAPSFAAFTLSHGILLESLWVRVLRDRGEVFDQRDPSFPFRIIGDDVAIWDPMLARAYRDWLDWNSVPISESKSLVSTSVSEFAGKVITPDQILPRLKWKSPSDNSFVDVARNLGPQSISLFTKRQRKVLEQIAEVPKEIGGLGWNPRGIPFEERLVSPESLALLGSDTSLQKRGLSMAWRIRNTSQYFEGTWPTGMTPVLPQYEGEKTVKEKILDATNVLQEDFADLTGISFEYRSGWYDRDRISDPRGQSLVSALERKLDNATKPADPTKVLEVYYVDGLAGLRRLQQESDAYRRHRKRIENPYPRHCKTSQELILTNNWKRKYSSDDLERGRARGRPRSERDR